MNAQLSRCLQFVGLSLLFASTAHAFPQFKTVFLNEYVKESENEEWVKLTREANCLVCHQGAKNKHNLNPYGAELHTLIGKKDKKDVEKVVAALKEVADRHTVADDEESPTYGSMIAEGKLPGGELEALKEEPKDGEGHHHDHDHDHDHDKN